MMIIAIIQDITQTPVMEDFALKLIIALIGLITSIGGAYYLVLTANARLTRAQAQEREVGSKGSELTLEMVNEGFETYKRDVEKRSDEREKMITRLQEGQAKFQEELEFMKEQLNIQKGEKNALFKTNEALVQDNYKISTDLGAVTESKNRLQIQIEMLEAKIALLTKERDDCTSETVKEREAFNVQIQVMTTEIAALKSELAEKSAPPEAIELKVDAAITLETPGESAPSAAESQEATEAK